MSHDVLQVFGVHSSLGKPSAESVPHGMGRDVRQGLIRLVVLVVLPDKPLEHALVAGRRFGKAALVEEQEVGVTPDIDRGGAALSVLHVLHVFPFLPIFRNRSAPSRLTADV